MSLIKSCTDVLWRMTICKPKLEANLVNWEGMLGEVAKTNVSRIFK